MFQEALVGESLDVHSAVMDDVVAEEQACGARLAHLRTLITQGKLKEALSLSLAFEPQHRLSKAHPDCHVDKPHVGEGTVTTRVATPDRHKNPKAKPSVSTFVALHHDDSSAHEVTQEFLRVVHSSGLSARRKPGVRVPIVGFALDGAFVLADAHLRCTSIADISSLSCSGGGDIRNQIVKGSEAAAALASELTGAKKLRTDKKSDRRLMTKMGKPLHGNPEVVAAEFPEKVSSASRVSNALTRTMVDLGDMVTDYALGAKTVLVIPVVPSDGIAADDQTGYPAPVGFDYGLVTTDHGSNINSYIQACMQSNSDFYKNNSWGAMELDWTVTPVLQVQVQWTIQYLKMS
jgi:hypothetical protein